MMVQWTRGLAVVLTVSSLTACGHSSVPVPAAPSFSEDSVLNDEELGLIDRINALRAEYGLNALGLDPSLQKAARAHSEYMREQGRLDHAEPAPNTTSEDRIGNAGGEFNATGENIACGNSDGAATFLQWKNSPGHLANLLGRDYQFLGIARVGASTDPWVGGCKFFWTLDLGGR